MRCSKSRSLSKRRSTDHKWSLVNGHAIRKLAARRTIMARGKLVAWASMRARRTPSSLASDGEGAAAGAGAAGTITITIGASLGRCR
jgi:hypothetical protein